MEIPPTYVSGENTLKLSYQPVHKCTASDKSRCQTQRSGVSSYVDATKYLQPPSKKISNTPEDARLLGIAHRSAGALKEGNYDKACEILKEVDRPMFPGPAMKRGSPKRISQKFKSSKMDFITRLRVSRNANVRVAVGNENKYEYDVEGCQSSVEMDNATKRSILDYTTGQSILTLRIIPDLKASILKGRTARSPGPETASTLTKLAHKWVVHVLHGETFYDAKSLLETTYQMIHLLLNLGGTEFSKAMFVWEKKLQYICVPEDIATLSDHLTQMLLAMLDVEYGLPFDDARLLPSCIMEILCDTAHDIQPEEGGPESSIFFSRLLKIFNEIAPHHPEGRWLKALESFWSGDFDNARRILRKLPDPAHYGAIILHRRLLLGSSDCYKSAEPVTGPPDLVPAAAEEDGDREMGPTAS